MTNGEYRETHLHIPAARLRPSLASTALENERAQGMPGAWPHP